MSYTHSTQEPSVVSRFILVSEIIASKVSGYLRHNKIAGYAIGVTAMLVSSLLAWSILGVVPGLLETAAVATSFICTALFVTQNRETYWFGVASTFLFCTLFAISGLWALSIFNGILVLSLIYGWLKWGPDGRPIPVTYASKREWFAYVIFGVVVTGLFVGLLSAAGMEILLFDVLAAGLSAVAQLLLDRKNRETWIIWAVVNILSLYLFWEQALYLVFIQYVFFLINTGIGWLAWKPEGKTE